MDFLVQLSGVIVQVLQVDEVLLQPGQQGLVLLLEGHFPLLAPQVSVVAEDARLVASQ